MESGVGGETSETPGGSLEGGFITSAIFRALIKAGGA